LLDSSNLDRSSFEFATRVMALAESTPLETFKADVVDLLGSFIEFDSAQWVTRARMKDEAGRPYLSEAYLCNLDSSKMSDYQPYIADDLLLKTMMLPENWNKALDLRFVWPDEEYFSSQLYTEYAEKYGLDRILSVLCVRENANFCQAITLYRSDRDNLFSEVELDFFQKCAHWMSIGLKHNILERVGSSVAVSGQRPRAVIDSDGFIFEIDAHLENWLNSQVLNFDGVYFPDSLLTRFSLEGDQLEYPYYRLLKKTLGDLTLVYFNSSLEFESLTDAEWKVAKLTMEGQSNKRTAVELGIEQYTVQKHMQNIYNKLDIAELNDNHEKRRILSVWLSDYLRHESKLVEDVLLVSGEKAL